MLIGGQARSTRSSSWIVREASKQTPEQPGVPGNGHGERVASLIQRVGFVPFEQVSTPPVGHKMTST
jgi:hypothetical protein